MCEFPATRGERKDAVATTARKSRETMVLLRVERKVESLTRSAESATVKDQSTTSDASLYTDSDVP